MTGRDLYRVLGVPKDASEDDIRKAYKKKAVKCHPDKCPEKDRPAAEEQFKVLAEAYTILSDPEKRKLYDMYGEDGLTGGAAPSSGFGADAGAGFHPSAGGHTYTYHGDPNELFASLFGGSFGTGSPQKFSSGKRTSTQPFNMEDLLHGMHGAQPNQHSFFATPNGNIGKKQKRVQHNLPVSLEELYTGCTKKMRVHRQSLTSKRTPEKVLQIDVKPGWKEGTTITFDNEGNEIRDGVFEDISFVVKEKAHSQFKREGDNLTFEKTVPLVDALTGCKIDVPHLDGKLLRVNIKDVIRPNYEKIVAGRGMPKKSSNGQYGDLVIKFNVTYPTTIGEEQKELIRRALPGKL